MATIISPNMSLTIPIVGQELGPQYALDVNSALSQIDLHNHTPGFGVQVPSAGINWNTDLSAQGNRLKLLKSATFNPQGSPLPGSTPDNGALYVSGVDLYYNDISGNQIRITQAGSVNSGNGSISGLVAPASASYSVSGSEFIWQSGINIAAGMDNGPITIRDETLNAKGITIQSPIALAADYSLTLLTGLPVSNLPLSVDPSGNITAVQISTTQISNNAVTRPKLASVGQQISSSSGAFSSSGAPAPITNLSVTITTTGRPVMLFCQSDGTSNDCGFRSTTVGAGSQNTAANILLTNDGGSTFLSTSAFYSQVVTSSQLDFLLPPSSFLFLDTPIAGTYTYDLWFQNRVAGNTFAAQFVVLVAYEL